MGVITHGRFKFSIRKTYHSAASSKTPQVRPKYHLVVEWFFLHENRKPKEARKIFAIAKLTRTVETRKMTKSTMVEFYGRDSQRHGYGFGVKRLVNRFRCWWFGCYQSPLDYAPIEDATCDRCGGRVSCSDMVGDTRAERFKALFSWFSPRRLWPRKCPDCGRRYKCDDAVDHLPF